MLLAAVLSGATARQEGHARRDQNAANSNNGLIDFANDIVQGIFSFSIFGERTPSSNSGNLYLGNIGNPYGSNIRRVEANQVRDLKYVIKFQGSETTPMHVGIFNKMIMEDGQPKLAGACGRAFEKFSIGPGETVYYAADEDTQAGWVADVTPDFPVNATTGFYTSTWGEFDFGSDINDGWSAYDVSAIQAQLDNKPVRGMKICDVASNAPCSSITNSGVFDNSYSADLRYEDGIGGNLPANPVRLEVQLDYNG